MRSLAKLFSRTNNYTQILPFDILSNVCSFLEIQDLCRVAQVPETVINNNSRLTPISDR
jgi:hypothetical protein